MRLGRPVLVGCLAAFLQVRHSAACQGEGGPVGGGQDLAPPPPVLRIPSPIIADASGTNKSTVRELADTKTSNASIATHLSTPETYATLITTTAKEATTTKSPARASVPSKITGPPLSDSETIGSSITPQSETFDPPPIPLLDCIARGVTISADQLLQTESRIIVVSKVSTFSDCASKCTSSFSCSYFSYNFLQQTCTVASGEDESAIQWRVDPYSASAPASCDGYPTVCPRTGVWYAQGKDSRVVMKGTLWECQNACLKKLDCAQASYDLNGRHCKLLTSASESASSLVLFSDAYIVLFRNCPYAQNCDVAPPAGGDFYYMTPDPEASEAMTEKHRPSKLRPYASVPSYTVVTYSCADDKLLIPTAKEVQPCQPDGTFVDMMPSCVMPNHKLAVLTDPDYISDDALVFYMEVLQRLFKTVGISKMTKAAELREALQGSSALFIPPSRVRGKLSEALLQDAMKIQMIRAFLDGGGAIFLFSSDNDLPAVLFDWTFVNGQRCQFISKGSGAGTATIIPPIYPTMEIAYGVQLESAFRSKKDRWNPPSALLTCVSVRHVRLSPLFTLRQTAEGQSTKGSVTVIGLDLSTAGGIGRDNWAQAIVQAIAQMSTTTVHMPDPAEGDDFECVLDASPSFGAFSLPSGSSRALLCPPEDEYAMVTLDGREHKSMQASCARDGGFLLSPDDPEAGTGVEYRNPLWNLCLSKNDRALVLLPDSTPTTLASAVRQLLGPTESDVAGASSAKDAHHTQVKIDTLIIFPGAREAAIQASIAEIRKFLAHGGFVMDLSGKVFPLLHPKVSSSTLADLYGCDSARGLLPNKQWMTQILKAVQQRSIIWYKKSKSILQHFSANLPAVYPVTTLLTDWQAIPTPTGAINILSCATTDKTNAQGAVAFVTPEGKGFLYTDLIIPQSVQKLSLQTVYSLRTLILPYGLAWAQALEQVLKPTTPVSFSIQPVPTNVPSTPPPLTGTGSAQTLQPSGSPGGSTGAGGQTSSATGQGDSASHSPKVGIVVGSVVGVVAAGAAFGTGFYFIARKKRKTLAGTMSRLSAYEDEDAAHERDGGKDDDDDDDAAERAPPCGGGLRGRSASDSNLYRECARREPLRFPEAFTPEAFDGSNTGNFAQYDFDIGAPSSAAPSRLTSSSRRQPSFFADYQSSQRVLPSQLLVSRSQDRPPAYVGLPSELSYYNRRGSDPAGAGFRRHQPINRAEVTPGSLESACRDGGPRLAEVDLISIASPLRCQVDPQQARARADEIATFTRDEPQKREVAPKKRAPRGFGGRAAPTVRRGLL